MFTGIRLQQLCNSLKEQETLNHSSRTVMHVQHSTNLFEKCCVTEIVFLQQIQDYFKGIYCKHTFPGEVMK